MTNLITLTREEIKQYLPHREPMLLVDEMALYEDENGNKVGQTITTDYDENKILGIILDVTEKQTPFERHSTTNYPNIDLQLLDGCLISDTE